MLRQLALSIDDAKKIAAAARAEAERNNWSVVVAIVDDGGHLMYLERMDGTQKASSIVAQEKAKHGHSLQAPERCVRTGCGGGPRRGHVAAGRDHCRRRPADHRREPVRRRDRRLGRPLVAGRADRQSGRRRARRVRVSAAPALLRLGKFDDVRSSDAAFRHRKAQVHGCVELVDRERLHQEIRRAVVRSRAAMPLRRGWP